MNYSDFSDGELFDAFTKAVRNKMDTLVQGRPKSFKDALILAGNTTLDCSNQCWRGIDFSGQDLSYINFSNSDLTGCRFDDAILLDTNLLATRHDGASCFFTSIGSAASLISLLGIADCHHEPLDLDESSVVGSFSYFENADLGLWVSPERLKLMGHKSLNGAFSQSYMRPSGLLRSYKCADSLFRDGYYKLSAAVCAFGTLLGSQLDVGTARQDKIVFRHLKIREAAALANCDRVEDGIRVLQQSPQVVRGNRNQGLLERCYLALLLVEVRSERAAISQLYPVVNYYCNTHKDREANEIIRDLNRLKVLIERGYSAKRPERFQKIVADIITLIDPSDINHDLAVSFASEMHRPFPFSKFK